MLHNTWLERLARDKHSNLLGPFVSYEETEVLLIWPQEFAHKVGHFKVFHSSLLAKIRLPRKKTFMRQTL
jgi:hypothetical protein